MQPRAFLSLLCGALLTCAAAAEETPLTTVLFASGFDQPTHAASPPGDLQRLFVTERKSGLVWIVENGTVLSTPFLDVSTSAPVTLRDLWSITFHPDFELNGYFYVYYKEDDAEGAYLERYTVSAGDANIADPGSGFMILTTPLPVAAHMGSGPVFGPDGLMYVGLGDGSIGEDPLCDGQNPASFFGSILRIDVDSGSPYAIPPTNPFLGVAGHLPELWAIGLRNPWRMSFDRQTGDLYIGDVGQSQREEIDFEPAGFAGGNNYGWSVEEGSVPYAHNCPPGTPDFGSSLYTRPIHEYDHSVGCSVTGGFVYRGGAIPDLAGTYFFGDYCTDGSTEGIWSFRIASGRVTDFRNRTRELQPDSGGPIRNIVSFAEDASGELFLVDHLSGEIYVVVPRCGTQSFCQTAPNSVGPGAILASTGSVSISDSTFTLQATGSVPGQFGAFFYGPAEVLVPFGDGFQCVAPGGLGLFRLNPPVAADATGDASYSLAFDQPPASGGVGAVEPGTTWSFQFWYRDPFGGGGGFNLSDGLRVTFCP